MRRCPRCPLRAVIVPMVRGPTLARSPPPLGIRPSTLSSRHPASPRHDGHHPSPALPLHILTPIPLLCIPKALRISLSTALMLPPSVDLLYLLHQPQLLQHQYPSSPTTRPTRGCQRSSSWLAMLPLVHSTSRTSLLVLYPILRLLHTLRPRRTPLWLKPMMNSGYPLRSCDQHKAPVPAVPARGRRSTALTQAARPHPQCLPRRPACRSTRTTCLRGQNPCSRPYPSRSRSRPPNRSLPDRRRTSRAPVTLVPERLHLPCVAAIVHQQPPSATSLHKNPSPNKSRLPASHPRHHRWRTAPPCGMR